MALPALIQAAIARLRAANNNAYDATSNPSGLGQGGHRQNLIPDMNAVADIGVFAGECADKADADVALTHADVALTHQDASNTGLDRIATAQSVLDAAGKVGHAAAEADRAKAQADLAKGFATGLKLPAVTPDMAGRFLKVNADGTAYELGLITIATAAEINAGTGTGFANAQTLGPILTDMKAKTSDLTAAAIPIGGYLVVPFMAPNPGPKFLRALGQKISLAAYPKASALPVVGAGDLSQYPWSGNNDTRVAQFNFASGSGTNPDSPFRSADIVGNRVVVVQNSYLRYFELAGQTKLVERVGTITNNMADGGYSCVLRDNDVVTMGANGRPTNLSILAGNFGAVTSYSGGVNGLDTQSKLVSLPNGTVLAFISTTSTTSTVLRQRKSEAAGVWSAFTPDIGAFLTNEYRVWQDKQGRVYLYCRAATTNLFNVYRTADGETWTNLGQVAGTVGGGAKMMAHQSWNSRDSKRPGAPAYRESPNGAMAMVRGSPNYNPDTNFVLATVNGGDSWKVLTRDTVVPGFPTTPLGNTASGQQNGAFMFEWDRFRQRWVFATIWRNLNQIWYAVSYSTDLVNFTNIITPRTRPTPESISGTVNVFNVALLCTLEDVLVYATDTNGTRYNLALGVTSLVMNNISDDSVTYTPFLTLEDPSFDGIVMGRRSPGDPGAIDLLYQAAIDGLRWMLYDRTFFQAANDPWGGYYLLHMLFAESYVFGGYSQNMSISAKYDHNPATERVLPRLDNGYDARLNSSQSTLIENSSRGGQAHGALWYMRVD